MRQQHHRPCWWRRSVAERDTDDDQDRDSEGFVYPYPNSDAYKDVDSAPDGDADTHQDSDANPDGEADCNCDSHRYSDAKPHGNADTEQDANLDGDSDADTNSGSDAERDNIAARDANACRFPDSYANSRRRWIDPLSCRDSSASLDYAQRSAAATKLGDAKQLCIHAGVAPRSSNRG